MAESEQKQQDGEQKPIVTNVPTKFSFTAPEIIGILTFIAGIVFSFYTIRDGIVDLRNDNQDIKLRINELKIKRDENIKKMQVLIQEEVHRAYRDLRSNGELSNFLKKGKEEKAK